MFQSSLLSALRGSWFSLVHPLPQELLHLISCGDHVQRRYILIGLDVASRSLCSVMGFFHGLCAPALLTSTSSWWIAVVVSWVAGRWSIVDVHRGTGGTVEVCLTTHLGLPPGQFFHE